MRFMYTGRVRRIIDGDTLILQDIDLGFNIKLDNIKFRLNNFNAPEARGTEKPIGKIAKRKLQELLPVNTEVLFRSYKADAFGRYLADIILPDGQTLSAFLVKLGYGVHWDGKGKRPSFDPSAPYPDSSLQSQFQAAQVMAAKAESHPSSEQDDPSQS